MSLPLPLCIQLPSPACKGLIADKDKTCCSWQRSPWGSRGGAEDDCSFLSPFSKCSSRSLLHPCPLQSCACVDSSPWPACSPWTLCFLPITSLRVSGFVEPAGDRAGLRASVSQLNCLSPQPRALSATASGTALHPSSGRTGYTRGSCWPHLYKRSLPPRRSFHHGYHVGSLSLSEPAITLTASSLGVEGEWRRACCGRGDLGRQWPLSKKRKARLSRRPLNRRFKRS